jgi:ribose transport system ATP-binding protein
MSEQPILEVRDVCKSFPGVRALNHVSLSVGLEIHGLVGENGAGKSTLIKILSGAYAKDSGDLYLRGQPLHITDPRHALDLGIHSAYQEVTLVPYMTVGENILLGHEPCRLPGVIDYRRLYDQSRTALEGIGVEHIDPRLPVWHYNLADGQLICIAKAVQSKEASVLILDESTASLSPHEVEQLFQVIRRVVDKGTAVVYISHRLEEVVEIADRVTVLKDGEVIGVLTRQELSVNRLTSLMIGRNVSLHYPTREKRIEEPKTLLEVRGVSRKGVLEDINLELRAGEILGIAGLLGAGRTELARAIFGADPVDAGEFYLDGKRINISSPRDAVRHGLALLTEDRKAEGLLLCRPVKDNLTLANLKAISQLLGFINLRRERSICKDYVEALDIKTPSLQQWVRYLSGGNQQKVIVAKWLFTKARIVIFDEPTRGIDVGAKFEVHKLIHQMADEGKAVVVISSDIPEVIAVSDRIVVIRNGRLVGELVGQEKNDEHRILALAAGLAAIGQAGQTEG